MLAIDVLRMHVNLYVDSQLPGSGRPERLENISITMLNMSESRADNREDTRTSARYI